MIIYKITNLINGKIYIGQHKGLIDNYWGGGKNLKKAIKKYGIKNFIKEIIVQGDFNQNLTDSLEIHYIRLYNSNNRNIGYNLQKGGRGYKNTLKSEEYRQKCRERMKGNKIMNGRKRSIKSKLKQAETWSNKQKLKSKEDRRKSALKGVETRKQNYNIGQLISKSRQNNKKLDWNNKQTKPVIQYDLNGNFIKLWASAYQAQKEANYRSSSISRVCKNKPSCKTYKKYIWKFATEEEILILRGRNKSNTKK